MFWSRTANYMFQNPFKTHKIYLSALNAFKWQRFSHEGVGLPRPVRNEHERGKQPLALLSSSSPKSCAHPYQEIIDLIIGELRGRCQKHLNSLYFQFMKPFVTWYYGFIRFVHLAGNLLL